MGACYSKGSASAKHLKQKAPKGRNHASKSGEEFVNSIPLIETQHKHQIRVNESEHLASHYSTVVSGFPDLVNGLEDQNEQKGGIGTRDKGVAPSDSGLESIGVVVQEETLSAEEASTLSNKIKIERLSRGSCHKCGNFRLDDNALTALLSNTYCLCGPRQAGRPSVNPDCQTHGVKKDFERSHSMPADFGKRVPDFEGNENASPFKSNLKKTGCEKREKTLRLSIDDNLDCEKVIHAKNGENLKLPLEQFDSSDNVLEDSLIAQKRLSRRSLLSEILDITDSICKCDFYSSECSVGEGNSGKLCEEAMIGRSSKSNTDCNFDGDMDDPFDESLALSGSSASNSDITNVEDSPAKKSASLSKFVTFAAHEGISLSGREEISGEYESHSCPISPVKGLKHLIGLRNSISGTSSGVDMHSADTSGSVHTPHWDDCHGAEKEPYVSASSYEAVDCTEDDMASFDMDSLSRVTSLSYSSIRHLLESTEDLVEPLDNVRRMNIDGQDFVIIPTQTYKQMQSDLNMLKDQLLALSSLLQEESDTRTRKAMSFCFDQDRTPTTPRRFRSRSQEYVDMM